MKRLMALTLLAIVLIVVIVVSAALEAQRPVDWQVTLEAYLAHSVPPARASIYAAVQAGHPWAFSRDMGHVVFQDWRWDGWEAPFPPEEVWCVLLARQPRGEAGYDFLFMTYHSDNLWRYGWLVHERPDHWPDQALPETLIKIGCNLESPPEPLLPGDLVANR